MTPELRAACERAVHVLTSGGRTLRAGKAALFVLERTTGPWRAFAKVTRFPPLLWGVEAGYFIVARNRNRFARLIVPKSGR